MIDYEKIGARITEERKYLRKVSQEKMAEDLGMYQADISNLEHARKGSGITDLSKLELIADYFDIPLETLLFGREDKNMLKYQGSKMQLKPCNKKIKKTHQKVLAKLTGQEADQINAYTFECGPYTSYVLEEHQIQFGSNTTFIDGKMKNPQFTLIKLHTYVFFGTEVIGAMVADVTTTMQHIYQPHLQQLQTMIQRDVLDVTDVWRTLNPYWALYMFSEDEKEETEYKQKMYNRMDEIRSVGNMVVLYIESAYVREDSRHNGIFHMFLDIMKLMCNDCVMWLNMEPTAGAELSNEYSYFPSYTISELGQLSMNASIAEKLGFTVDPDTWHRQADVLNAEGDIETKVIEIRKCAYYLPKAIREIVKNDGGLVALGRAKQRIVQSKDCEEETVADIKDGIVEGYEVMVLKTTVISGPNIGQSICCYAAKTQMEDDVYKFGVSIKSVFDSGLNHQGQFESYDYLDEAMESEHYDTLSMLNMMLIARFGDKKK